MKYIVELSHQEAAAIGKALHILLGSDDKFYGAEDALKQIHLQTNAVQLDPKKHEVYYDDKDASPLAVRFSGPKYVPSRHKKRNLEK